MPTLYVRNLNDKVNLDGKSRPIFNCACSEMRICLFHLFSTYGEVLQVRMRQTQQLRGQAFVVFRDQINADLAKHQLAAFNVYGN